MGDLIFAIDPGPLMSAWVWYEPSTRGVSASGWDDNAKVSGGILQLAPERHDFDCVVEDFVGRGQPCGSVVVHSVAAVHYFRGLWRAHFGRPAVTLKRSEVCVHFCGDATASKAAVNAMMYERFGGGIGAAKGTQDNPGPLYGTTGQHIKDALALAITFDETRGEG